MQIQHQALAQHLKHKLVPLYFLIGPDQYCIGEQAKTIKSSYRSIHECDDKTLIIQSPDEWSLCIEEANSYSLFAQHVFLDVRYDKKSLDATGKKMIQHYLSNANNRCLVLIRAPNIPAKQLQWLSSQEQAVLITGYPLSARAMRTFIVTQLKQKQLDCDERAIDFLLYKVQGNMLACAQAIEKIVLTHPPHSKLTYEELTQELSDQSEYQLYDLTEACLAGNTETALRITRQFLTINNEFSLLLWMLTQEIRLLLQLQNLMNQNIPFTEACSQLKIWRHRTKLYQTANRRVSQAVLQSLLLKANHVDDLFKSTTGPQIDHMVEDIVISLSIGKS